MQGITDLFASERGIFAIVLCLTSTILAWPGGVITAEQWLELNKWIGTVLIGSKTITTAIEMLKRPTTQQPPPSATVTKDGSGASPSS